MRDSLKVLIDYHRRKEEEYRSKVEVPGTLCDVSYSEELNVVLGMTTRWVAAAVKTKYDSAISSSVSDSYAFKDNGDTITVKGGTTNTLS
ncbi:hypothetical protein PC129_g15983 [Phytophthora cactorum]|nr:hypothetical protein Pcac1_g21001 [Phytophthora cactorum]KAG2886894.1 hypothetical protein PC114_g19057 [Phytophthora cactorum]KAG2913616.1 hypothetical protein PC117_g18526 [Phytophthora cactorum]KAG2970890.1 hypothetical protein PC118_g16602 [Phytophthora cactorum]KAG3183977.1 hypothetical protein PC128_g13919 [Phytophthora cactorum]